MLISDSKTITVVVACLLLTSHAGCDAFKSTSFESSVFVASIGNRVVLVDRRGNETYQFPLGGFAPRWSLDGESVVFSSSGGLTQMRPRGVAPKFHKDDSGNTLRTSYIVPLEDNTFLFQYHADFVASYITYRFDPSSGQTERLPPEHELPSIAANNVNGPLYYIERFDSSGTGNQVLVIDSPGSEPKPITTNRSPGAGQLALSRDGAFLAYTESGGRVFVMPVSEPTATRLIDLSGSQLQPRYISLSPNADSLLIGATEVGTGGVERHFLVVADVVTGTYRTILLSDRLIIPDWRPATSRPSGAKPR